MPVVRIQRSVQGKIANARERVDRSAERVENVSETEAIARPNRCERRHETRPAYREIGLRCRSSPLRSLDETRLAWCEHR